MSRNITQPLDDHELERMLIEAPPLFVGNSRQHAIDNLKLKRDEVFEEVCAAFEDEDMYFFRRLRLRLFAIDSELLQLQK